MEIMKGWEEFSFEGQTDVGILVSQGFTGSTASVREWGEKLNQAGFHIEGPRLAGHGTQWQDLNHVTYQDWLADEEAALAKLKKRADRIFVAGLSMGGALVMHLAENHPEILGISVVNNAINLYDPRAPFIGIIKLLIEAVPAISSDVKKPDTREIAYDKTPTKGTYQLSKLLKEVRKNLSKITQPIQIFKSREDHVLPVKNATYTFEHVASSDKELIWLDNSYHVATIDNDKDFIFNKSIEFFNAHK